MILLNNTWRMTMLLHLYKNDSCGEEGQSTPNFSCMEWITDCWYIAGSLSQRSDNWSYSPVTWGGHLIFRSSFNWAGKPGQIEATINTMQEGHWAIVNAVVEKRTKARGSRMPLENEKGNIGSNHSIQHRRVNVELGRRVLQRGSEKWWHWWSCAWTKKHSFPVCWLR